MLALYNYRPRGLTFKVLKVARSGAKWPTGLRHLALCKPIAQA